MDLPADLPTAVESVLPEVTSALVLLLVLTAFRLGFRSVDLTGKLRFPSGLLLFYLTLAIAGAFLKEREFQFQRALELTSEFILALAVILVASVAIFDLFLLRYRKVEIAKILRDTIVLGLFVVTVLLILADSGFDVTSLVTTSAVLAAVIGFALQDLLSNIIGGLALQAEQPFQQGDWVGFDDQEGVVLELNWRSTKIKTLHNDIVVIPNNVITKESIINFTSPSPIHRRRFVVGLRYEVPPNKAKESLLKAVQSVEDVLERPKPYITLLGFDDFSINYRVQLYINQFRRRERIEDEVRTRIWYQLKRDGLTIPFPIRDVHLRTITEETQRSEHEVELGRTLRWMRGVPILEPLSDEELRELAERSRCEYYAAEEVVIEEGDEGDSMYVISSGAVDVCIGEERQVVTELGTGAYFGEMSLMTGERRSATIVTKNDCEFQVIDKQAFQALIESNDRLIAAICEKLESRRETLEEKHLELRSKGRRDPGIDTRTSLVSRIRSFFYSKG